MLLLLVVNELESLNSGTGTQIYLKISLSNSFNKCMDRIISKIYMCDWRKLINYFYKWPLISGFNLNALYALKLSGTWTRVDVTDNMEI